MTERGPARPAFRRRLTLPSLEATRRFAGGLAEALGPGDVLLLEGELGVGKTELACALIRARIGAEIEVPSPTFTLVQHYAAPDLLLTHADLYRLVDPDEVIELGLDEAWAEGCLLVEWPDRAPAGFFPEEALTLRLEAAAGPEAALRTLLISGAVDWESRLRHSLDAGASGEG